MRTLLTNAVAAVTVLALAPAASAGDTLTRSGPGTAGDGAFITYVGCESFRAPAAAPQTRLNLGPGVAPLGKRSLGLVPAGPGSASGPFLGFSSLSEVDAAVSVSSGTGTSGVSYAWVVTPDALPGTAWHGRASLTVPAAGWHQVRAAEVSYEWTLVELSTHHQVGRAGSATPAEFAASHGDGPGYVVHGFGCDGQGFNIDAVHGAGGTLDFEGVPLTTTTEVSGKVPEGETVVVSGSSRDAGGRLTGDPLVLETRSPGGAWQRVGEPRLADEDGRTRAELVVTGPTEVRWHRPETQYADEGWSDPVLVEPTAPGPGATGQ
ncbi:hypothetical protein EXE58_17040 [Nocardioides seonyuensis]|uniref:Uncharacterized protein n=1 Tax=Nocardioides seonyuensis TaxID=2518371 RepID=A0A4P7II27_9ACTN|nr:hypothetical protein [Nocardioides seonyuensis]QBX56974.1 hypothetical protein EXE58_17040 [Nocardioides seonyuensis]